MKKSSYLTFCLAIVIFVLSTQTSCASQENKKIDKLVVGTSTGFYPFEFMNEQNEIDGFDIALMKAVSEKIGVPVEFKDFEFDELPIALADGRINVIASAYSINETRLESSDFSESYFQNKQVVVVQSENNEIKSKENLAGKTIAVQHGTTSEEIAGEIIGAVVLRYETFDEIFASLENGGCDAIVLDSAPADYYVEKYKTKVKLVSDLVLAEEWYGFAVKKGNKELVSKLNKAISELHLDNTYLDLVKKYVISE